MENKIVLFSDLPKLDILYNQIKEEYEEIPSGVLKDIIRDALTVCRDMIREKKSIDYKYIMDLIKQKVDLFDENNLKPLINATGIVLHTNLGRSLLSKKVEKNMLQIATNYVNLEYDIQKGRRGDRYSTVTYLIKKILGVEDALVVNNNAAATLITLSSLAREKEVVISRGELVEIGGSFRIPDIMNESRAKLVEIGTTNKTRLKDYKTAINENTACLLKVHTSNYKIVGFHEEVEIDDLVKLKNEYNNLPLVYDLGSGLMVDLKQYGIDEPTVVESIKSGVDVILFSGDKLFGGPQAGIIAGKKEYIDKMKHNPLLRAVRVDKVTMAVLESTLKEYLDFENAKKTIPTLHMLTYSMDELKNKANKLKEEIIKKNNKLNLDIKETENEVGGGSAPTVMLKSYAVSIENKNLIKIEEKLRSYKIPIIAYINHDKLLLDIRTIDEKNFEDIANCLGEYE